MGNFLPQVVSYFEKSRDYKHELDMLAIKAQYTRQDTELEIAKIDSQASINEGTSVRTHDSTLDGGKYINALRASVRPVITYFFFFVFVAIKCIALYHGIYIQNLPILTLLPIIWDLETAAIFASIIAFWFGGRIIEKQYGIGKITSDFTTKNGK